MGCTASVEGPRPEGLQPDLGTAVSIPATSDSPVTVTPTSTEPKPLVLQDPESTSSPLSSRKWTMLLDWTGWHLVDQFGWEQPTIAEVVGTNECSMLGGIARPFEYQVAISFPGADFDQGSEGHREDITDHAGAVLASSGTEMAEALRGWLISDWLDGSEAAGLMHAFVCSENLKYCPGTVKAVNFRRDEPGSAGAGATALLNENWAMYLRESFLEARVIVFIVNQDWLDSVPCNQEFEAVLTRKRRFRPEGRDAIIFFDITDEKYNERWGAKLPQLRDGMADEAGRQFDVYRLTYNKQTSPADKLKVKEEFETIARKYGTKRDVPQALSEFMDHSQGAREVDWPNWLYYGALTDTNGWQVLLKVERPAPDPTRVVDGAHDEWWIPPMTLQPLLQPAPSRRYRLRFMGVTGNVFGEGFKFMMGMPELLTASGDNIVGPGKGYLRIIGDRMGECSMQHWCGTRQYSWFEWLVPDDQPAPVVTHVRCDINARHIVFEAMPADTWPSHADILKDFTWVIFQGAGDTGLQLPTWVTLHTVDSASWSAGSESAAAVTSRLPADAPACTQFRLRLLGTATPVSTIEAVVQLKAVYSEGLHPIGGGTVSGTGGDAAMETAPPSFAFDGDAQTRWIDCQGGGIGNVATWSYLHTEAVEVVSYIVMSQPSALASYHNRLAGSPRDWQLKAKSVVSGEWCVVDEQRYINFTSHEQHMTFKVASPLKAAEYLLEITAVSAGCSSKSLQVGDIQLLARAPAGERALQGHQVTTAASAYTAGALDKARDWSQPGLLSLAIPTHLEHCGTPLAAANGGSVQWETGPGQVDNWYDWPLQYTQDVKFDPDGPERVAKSQLTLVVRPRKEIILVDAVHKVSFRNEYHNGEATLTYTHPSPFVLKGYSFGSSCNYVRADPQSWSLEAETAEGQWTPLHSVADFHFQERSEPMAFCVPANEAPSARYRLVISRVVGLAGLLHLADFVLLAAAGAGQAQATAAAAADAGAEGDGEAAGKDACTPMVSLVPIVHREAAHVLVRIKRKEGEGGQIRLAEYTVACTPTAEGPPASAPTSWVLEGFTSQY